MTPPPGDTVLIVLWYRDSSDTPVFSYDLRNNVEKRRRWSNRTVFSDRADLVPERRPSLLTLQPSLRSDAALYRCRVDFQYARTRYALVNLTIVVPPESVQIVSSAGDVSDTVVGAFEEGQPLKLTCRVKGGFPRPRVVWKSSQATLPSSSRVEGDDVISEFTIAALSRSDLHRMLTCLATNTNLTAPATNSVMIDMNFAPFSVAILGQEPAFSAGRRYQLVCQCTGSRPPAAITWYLGGVRVAAGPDMKISHKGNVTMATLSLTPTPEDDRRTLLCRCQNPKMAAQPLEHSTELVVHYLPRVTITLAKLLDPDKIKEGDDVYFECSIRANPPVYKKEWRHNSRQLEHNAAAGIIVSNFSLALQDVQRSDSGVYMCVGFNVEGDGESNPIFLDVKFAPVCRPGLQRIYGVAKREQARVVCAVEANPAHSRFRWTFNNTSETTPLDGALFNSSDERSVLGYRPRSEMDYGTLFCWASNEIGRMASPCVFHIIAAGPPDPLYNCSIHNQTSSGLLARCLPGFDGGVLQTFLLNVYSDVGSRLVFSRTSDSPLWWVDGLAPGRRFRLQAIAQNAKGRSAAVVLDGSTLIAPQPQQETTQDFTIAEMQPEPTPVSPLLAVLVGVLGSLALLALVATLACLACRRRQRQRPPAAKQLATELASTSDGDEDKGPDVVLEAENETSYEVYQIPRNTPALASAEDRAAVAGFCANRNGDIPLRTLNHIVPLRATEESLPSEPPPPPRQPAPAVYATVDRRHARGAVSRLRSSDTRTPLMAASDGQSSL
ncbi:nephrin-like [Pollicipes pollicipes]|uniref:nephrin-like n=1 Tax=Pollicipes pollicipes TaxID=41117 RepID=UPI00188490DD|nr:nephrin-like [Pollicipes pollicipes]